MVLGNDFTFFATLLIIILLPLYIYRKKVFKFLYNKGDIKSFVKDLSTFLNDTYPKIRFSTNGIDLNDQSNDPRTLKVIIIEKFLNQYINFDYKIKTQNSVNKDMLWATYEMDSIPKKGPVKDLIKRKEYLLKRDDNRCNRCGKYIKKDSSNIELVKSVEDGGTYHFENLTLLCSDCSRIVNSKNPSNILLDLSIYDLLFKKYIN